LYIRESVSLFYDEEPEISNIFSKEEVWKLLLIIDTNTHKSLDGSAAVFKIASKVLQGSFIYTSKIITTTTTTT